MSFLRSLPPFGPARETFVAAALPRIDPPQWCSVTMGRVVLQVASDYALIDGERVPLSAQNAQRAADLFGAILPTPKIVEAIEAAARIVPMPTWPDQSTMLEASTFAWAQEQTGTLSGLVAGHRKDVVICKAMAARAGRVWIFGGRWRSGKRIETVAHGAHEASYSDYSHGIRLVLNECLLDGQPALVSDILSGPLAHLLSDEGPVPVRYPLPTPTDRPSAPSGPPTDRPPATPVTGTPAVRTLRRGMTGDDVRALQQRLTLAGFSTKADSIFGERTENAVKDYQRSRVLVVDGVVGRRTREMLAAEENEHDPSVAWEDDTNSDPLILPGILSDAEVDALLGPALWVPAPRPDEPGAVKFTNGFQANIVPVKIPQLIGVAGAPASGTIYLHRKVVEQTRAMFDAWERDGLKKHLWSFAGSYNPRLVRGHQTLSRHSYGAAIDCNYAWNVLGKPGAARGQPGSVVELYPIAVEHGYTAGKDWARPDWGHFEVFEVK